MLITYVRSYPKLTEDGHQKRDRNGFPITVFVYHVTGPAKELEEYKRIQTENDVTTVEDDDGKVLFFTTRPIGNTGELKISHNGKIYADTSKLDMSAALIKQYGILGQIMAKDIMQGAPVPMPAVINAGDPDPLD